MASANPIKDNLTADEYRQLQNCLDVLDDLDAHEPEYTLGFEESAEEWKTWQDKRNAAIDENSNVIVKAITALIKNYNVNDSDGRTLVELIRYFLADKRNKPEKPQLPAAARDLLAQPYIINLTSTLTDVLYGLTLKDFETDKIADTATINRNGVEIKIESLSTFVGGINSVLKLFDAITGYLAFYNPDDAKTGLRTTIEIPLVEYATARGIKIIPDVKESKKEQQKENQRAKNRRNAFIRDLHRDLDNLSHFRITGEIKKGKHKEEYQGLVLIYPDHAITNDIIKVNMPADTARMLLNSYDMYYSVALQRTDDRNPNTYKIGRKMNTHNCIDNNIAARTNNTLKVKTLVSSTKNIPNLSELPDENRWKDRIKDKLEQVFKALIDIGFLEQWEYRNAVTDEIYTPKQARDLSANEYWELDVDYTLVDNKQQQERIKRKAKEREEAAAKQEEAKQITTKKKVTTRSEKATTRCETT